MLDFHQKTQNYLRISLLVAWSVAIKQMSPYFLLNIFFFKRPILFVYIGNYKFDATVHVKCKLIIKYNVLTNTSLVIGSVDR